jgi:hypothetical protein
MLRTFGAFLAMFWLLGLIVQLDGLAHLFGLAALTLFAIDCCAQPLRSARASRGARIGPLQ